MKIGDLIFLKNGYCGIVTKITNNFVYMYNGCCYAPVNEVKEVYYKTEKCWVIRDMKEKVEE